jgi:hypothetical protein
VSATSYLGVAEFLRRPSDSVPRPVNGGSAARVAKRGEAAEGGRGGARPVAGRGGVGGDEASRAGPGDGRGCAGDEEQGRGLRADCYAGEPGRRGQRDDRGDGGPDGWTERNGSEPEGVRRAGNHAVFAGVGGGDPRVGEARRPLATGGGGAARPTADLRGERGTASR